MEWKRLHDAANQENQRKKRGSLLGVLGWTLAGLGVVLLALGLWRQFHSPAQFTAQYQDADMYVSASYGKDARIPAGAELRARLITPESDPGVYEQSLTDALTAAGRDTAPSAVLLRVGFFLGDEEVEPAGPVAVRVRFLRDSLAAGGTATVVHLGAGGPEVLANAQVDETGSACFTAGSFSDFVLIFGEGEAPADPTDPADPAEPADPGDPSESADPAEPGEPGAPEGGDSPAAADGDISELLDEVTITDADGNPIEDGTLYVGESYKVKLKFKEKGAQGKQFHPTEDGKLTYQIPPNFKVDAQSGKELKVTIDGHEYTCTYEIDDNGKLTITLPDDAKQKFNESYDVFIEFEMDATAQRGPDGTGDDVHFGDAGKDFNFQVTDQPQITAEKTGNFNQETHLLEYTVHTTVEHGEVHNLDILDQLTKPTDSAITLNAVDTDGDGKPDISVKVKKADGEPVELDPEDYEIVEETNENGKLSFHVKLKDGTAYSPLQKGDEVFVTYQYEATFHPEEYGLFWANVVNEATVTGTMPVTDPETGEEKDVPVQQKAASSVEVFLPNPGDGVVVKDEAYDEVKSTLHYNLYVAVSKGEHTPFNINDSVTVEYNGRVWHVECFDTDENSPAKNIEVYTVDLPDRDWDDVKDHPNFWGITDEEWGEPLPGYLETNGKPVDDYDPNSMENYTYRMWGTSLNVFFGRDDTHKEGYWNSDTHTLFKVSYDLDVSGGLTLVDTSKEEGDPERTLHLGRDDVLLAGLKNTVTLHMDHYSSNYSVFFGNGEKLNKAGVMHKNAPDDVTIDYTVTMGLGDTTVLDYMKKLADAYNNNNSNGDHNAERAWANSVKLEDDLPEGWDYVDGTLTATVYSKSGKYAIFPYHPGSRGAGTDSSPPVENGKLEAAFGCFEREKVSGEQTGDSKDKYSEEGGLNGNFLDQVFRWNVGETLDRVEFTYTLKATEAWLQAHSKIDEDIIVKNHAKIADSENSNRWSADAEVPYFPARLTKQGVQVDNSNLMRFSLHVNPDGLDLDTDHDYLIVTDTSTNLQIKPDSIKVTDADGHELKSIGETSLAAQLNDDEWGTLPHDETGQFKLKVPDGKHLVITYDALILEMGNNVQVSNKASIDGVERTESGVEQSLVVSSITGGGEGSTYHLSIEKTDSATGHKLAGAKFKFYIVLKKNSELKETQKISVGGKEYSCYTQDDWTLTTEEDGKAEIPSGWKLEPGNYYILVEETAPTGYLPLEEPILFYFGLKNGSNYEADLEVPIAAPDGILPVENAPVPYQLPKTGGPGGLVYAAAGLALMLGAVLILALRRRPHGGE